ncbi:HAD hydrolase-like protein [Candidatus Gracilibacteria bacterium]|nr:HAD hydrolase-like protein [Candidatus Gracilibacteria bacterium]
MKALIFDFDGVIHDTFDFHRNKIEEYFKITFSEEYFKSIHDGNIFASSPPEPIKSEGWEGYRDYIYKDYSSLIMDNSIKRNLLKLKESYSLHIISSGGTNNVSDLLRNNEFIDTFNDILCYEFHKSKVYKFNYILKKYKLKVEECLFVTDTLGDILEANEVGLKTIAVDFGYHERERLEKGNPYKIISDFSELFNILK